jgi:hypothetical protein
MFLVIPRKLVKVVVKIPIWALLHEMVAKSVIVDKEKVEFLPSARRVFLCGLVLNSLVVDSNLLKSSEISEFGVIYGNCSCSRS